MLDILKWIICPISCNLVIAYWKCGVIESMVSIENKKRNSNCIYVRPSLVNLCANFSVSFASWGLFIMSFISFVLMYLYVDIVHFKLFFILSCLSLLPIVLFLFSIIISSSYDFYRVLKGEDIKNITG